MGAPKLSRHVVLYAAIAAVALPLLALGVAQLPVVRARVLDYARAYAARELGVAVTAASLHYSLIEPSAELRNVTLASLDDPEGRAFLQADRVRVALDRGIFRGQVEVTHLELVRPRITIVRHADGTLNLPRGRGAASQQPTPLQLGNVDVRRLTLDLDDEATGHALALGPVDLAIDTSAAKPAPAAFGPSPFTLRLSARQQGEPGAAGGQGASPTELTGTLAGRLAFDGTTLRVPELTVETPEGRLAADGSIDLIASAPRLDVRAQLRVDLARAARLAGVDGQQVSGTLNATGTATGLLSAPDLSLGLEGHDLAVQSIHDITLAAASTLDDGRVKVSALDVRSPLGAIHAHGDVAFAAPPGTASHVVVRWTDIDLDRAIATLGYTTPARLGSRGSGSADLRLTGAAGTPLLSELDADVSAALHPGSAGLSLEGAIDLSLRRGAWSLRHRLASAPAGTSLAGTLRGSVAAGTLDSSLGGSTSLRVADLAAVVPLLQEAGTALPEQLADLAGKLDAEVTLGGTTAHPAVRATVTARDVQAAGLPAGTLDAALTATGDALRVQTLAMQLGPARLQATGSYAWSGRADVRFDAQASDLSVLARTFADSAAPVAGSAQLSGHAWGTLAAPQANATIDARDVSIDGTDVGRIDATLALAGTELHVEASAPALAVAAQADLHTRAPYGYAALVRFDRTKLDALVPASLRPQVPVSEGIFAGTIRADGTLRQPMEVRASAKLDALDAVVSGTRVVLEAPATIAWTPSRMAVDGLNLRIGQDARARLSGSLGVEPTRDPLRLTVESPLSELLVLARPALPAGTSVTADGTFAADLSIGGTLRAPAPSGTLTLRSAEVAYGNLPPATDLVIEARVEPAQIVVPTMAASWQQAALSANGTVPWRVIAKALTDANGGDAGHGWASEWLASLPPAPRTASLSARVTGLTPGILTPFAGADALGDVTGTMALSLTAEAEALSLAQTRARAVLDEASFNLAGVPFAQTVPTRIRLEDGQARIEEFRWDSLGNPIVVSGGANLAGPQPRVDVGVNGTLDLRALGAFATGVGAGGTARVNLAIAGAIDSPAVTGEVVLADGEFRVETPRLLASDVAGTIRVAADRTAVIAITGTINGGSAKASGTVDLTRSNDPRGAVTLTAQNVAMEYPDGFQTESNAQLTLTLARPGPALSGRVDVLGGTYREPIVVTGQLLEGLQQSGIATGADASGLLSTLRLDITVATTDAIRIDNNYGRLAIAGSLRIAGTPDRPGLVGRLEVEPDGELFLAGNTYRIERLVVDFANPNAIAPDLSFLAQTRVGNVPVDVELQCEAAGPCERQVRSLASGVTDEEAEAQLFGVPANAAAAGEQLARLLSGDVLGLVSRTVGLDTLRLEQGTRGSADIFDDPTLVAGDVDPASRLTLGKRLGENVELAYSQNLTGSGFTWSTTYHAPHGLSARVLLFDDQSRSYEFRHEPRIGGPPSAARPSRPPGPRVADVRIGGDTGLPERDLRRRLRLVAGKRFQFAAWQRDRDRLAELYHARGFHEARIRARRLPAAESGASDQNGKGLPEAGPGEVVLDYQIARGPETRLEVRGAALPDEVRDRILERWSSALFDGFLERDAATIVRSHLYREGYVHATMATTVALDDALGVKTLKVEVTPGPTPSRRLEFAGNDRVSAARLHEVAAAADTLTAWIAPATFAQAIERFYREEGFLTARVAVPPPSLGNGVSIVRVNVHEGPPFLFGRIALSGAEALPEPDIRKALDLAPGMPYRPVALAEGVGRIDALFRQAGFLAASTTVDTAVRQQDARVDATIAVNAGPKSILRDIVVEGGDAGKPLIARAITLEPGAPIDPDRLGSTRRRLYDTGVYRSVDIDLQPVDPGAASSAEPAADGTRPVDAHIQLLERARYRLRYGLAFNDEVVGPDLRDRRFGLAADLENRNLFGRGANAGVSARLRRDQQVGRLFVGANRFFGAPLRSSVFLERSREALNTEGAFPIVSTITDLSAEQAYSIRRRVEIRYGYALGRNSTIIEGQDFDLTVRVARLTSTALVDRRSDPFDPDRGWFASSSLELSRPSLGSDISFLKGFVQYFQFQPVGRGMVLASAVRLGLARTFEGEDLIPSERFFAGGATSVRGYREEDLGPRSGFGDADGGQGLLVINEELRFPVYRWLRGVGFVDLGNVYPAVGEISLSDLQVGIGAGVRVQSPVGLFRVDLGMPANGRPFDPKWKLTFGLGHTF